jgi:hypothetical protein
MVLSTCAKTNYPPPPPPLGRQSREAGMPITPPETTARVPVPAASGGTNPCPGVPAHDCHPEIKHSHPDMRSSHPDMRSSHPDMRSSHPDMRSSHPDMRSSHPDMRSSHPDMRSSHPDMRSSHPDMRSSHPDMRSSHPDMRSSRPETNHPYPGMLRFGVDRYPIGRFARTVGVYKTISLPGGVYG